MLEHIRNPNTVFHHTALLAIKTRFKSFGALINPHLRFTLTSSSDTHIHFLSKTLFLHLKLFHKFTKKKQRKNKPLLRLSLCEPTSSMTVISVNALHTRQLAASLAADCCGVTLCWGQHKVSFLVEQLFASKSLLN